MNKERVKTMPHGNTKSFRITKFPVQELIFKLLKSEIDN